MKEIWKDIKNFIGFYQVSNFGRVKSLARMVRGHGGSRYKTKERILKPGVDGSGYLFVFLYKDSKHKSFKIGRLVLSTFKKRPPKNHECNHIDGNKLNNNIENLEWMTHSENMIHAFKSGLLGRNIGFFGAEIKKIQKIYNSGKVFQKDLAKKYGVSQGTISRIVRGEIEPRDF